MITLLTRHKMPECLCVFWDNPTNTPGSLPRGARAPVLPSRVPRAASRLEPDPPFCSIQLFHQHQPLSKTNFWCTPAWGSRSPALPSSSSSSSLACHSQTGGRERICQLQSCPTGLLCCPTSLPLPRKPPGAAGHGRKRLGSLRKRSSSSGAHPGQPNTPRPGFVNEESLVIPINVRINHPRAFPARHKQPQIFH